MGIARLLFAVRMQPRLRVHVTERQMMSVPRTQLRTFAHTAIASLLRILALAAPVYAQTVDAVADDNQQASSGRRCVCAWWIESISETHRAQMRRRHGPRRVS